MITVISSISLGYNFFLNQIHFTHGHLQTLHVVLLQAYSTLYLWHEAVFIRRGSSWDHVRMMQQPAPLHLLTGMPSFMHSPWESDNYVFTCSHAIPPMSHAGNPSTSIYVSFITHAAATESNVVCELAYLASRDQDSWVVARLPCIVKKRPLLTTLAPLAFCSIELFHTELHGFAAYLFSSYKSKSDLGQDNRIYRICVSIYLVLVIR